MKIAARNSPLSQAQVREVFQELLRFHPGVQLSPVFTETIGDKDQLTSLRTLEKSDFFTREVDQLVLNKVCRAAVHSAKDLPEPLPKGLKVIALTKGVDPSDSLVFRTALPLKGRIATSSFRREEAVKALGGEYTFVDIRGTIEKRLEKLFQGDVEGVVIAEAALIRLGLTHLNRIKLPGVAAAGQGQLAIVAREEDEEMAALFKCLDSR